MLPLGSALCKDPLASTEGSLPPICPMLDCMVGGRGIIADTGYGVGGISMGHNEQWDDVRHLQDRIADGVVAVTQANYDARRAVVLEKVWHVLRCVG